MANKEMQELKVVDYIDRFEVLDILSKEADFFAEPPMDKEDYAKLKLLLEIKFKIDVLPTAKVVEVKHGEWVKERHYNASLDGGYFELYHCSECNTSSAHDKDNFCSGCGAKMDGGDTE